MSRDFDALLERARERVDAEATPPANFADLQARVHAAGDTELDELDPALAAITQRVKARTELEVMNTKRAASPVSAASTSSRSPWIALAAIGLLALGLGTLWRAQVGTQVQDDVAPNEAALAQPERVAPEAAQAIDRPAKTPLAPVEVEVEPEPEPEPETASERPPEPAAEQPKAKTKRVSRAERLDALLDEAETLWREGKPREAEAKLLQVVAKGRSPQADLAWGDLFTLARQLRGSANEYERWGEYLRVYPKGRHADDARAGRCRLGPAKAPRDCWAAYLEDFPHGAHRAEAEAGTRGGEP